MEFLRNVEISGKKLGDVMNEGCHFFFLEFDVILICIID